MIEKTVCDLSEIDAKYALLYLLHSCERTLHCDYCPAGCKESSPDSCMEKILAEALEDGGRYYKGFN